MTFHCRRFRLPVVALLVLALLSVGAAQAQDATEAAVCGVGFQAVTDAEGQKCVPEHPERVVVIEWVYVEDVLALGVQPVGVSDIEGYNDWVRIPVALDPGVQDVGDRSEPNLEVITALNPDLIIVPSFRLVENGDDLAAIAPTLVFDPYPTDGSSHYDEMVTTFTTIATALDREAEGRAVLEQMDAHYAAAKAALEAEGRGGEPFILSQGWTYEQVATFRLFTENAMAVQILERIGLTNAWNDQPQQYGYTEIGIEGFVPLGSQDFGFFYVAQSEDNDFFESSPLWSQLPFAQARRAYWLGGDVWLFGGPLSAEVLVDTVLGKLGVTLPEATAEATVVAST